MRRSTPGTRVHAKLLSNLANAYPERAGATGDPDDFDRAVELAEQAAAEIPPDSPGYVGTLADLGSHYHDRYRRFGNLADLDRSINIKNDALARCERGSPRWLSVANDVAVGTRERFSRMGMANAFVTPRYACRSSTAD